MNFKKLTKWGVILIAFLAYKQLYDSTPTREMQYMSTTMTNIR